MIRQFWDRISHYGNLSEESREAWQNLLFERHYDKNEYFVKEGQIPKTIAFVFQGLFSQYYTSSDGVVVIKRFFPEQYLVASFSALLQNGPGIFTIRALEPSVTLEYNFQQFKRLTERYSDIAALYIRYMEIHWVLEKEPQEISLRHDTARTRYIQFLQEYPNLEPRLKQHEVAAFLGVTPTQLSRIRAGL